MVTSAALSWLRKARSCVRDVRKLRRGSRPYERCPTSVCDAVAALVEPARLCSQVACDGSVIRLRLSHDNLRTGKVQITLVQDTCRCHSDIHTCTIIDRAICSTGAELLSPEAFTNRFSFKLSRWSWPNTDVLAKAPYS